MVAFRNRSVNLVYIHAGLQAFVMNGGEAFVFVYLLKAGLSPAVVLLCIAGMFGSRMLFRMGVVPLVLRFGLRRVLIGSVIVEGASYLLLPLISSVGPLLVLYLGIWAISSSFYWTTYHAYVAQVGNSEHRGTQVSTMEFVGMLAGIGAPLIMSLLLTWFSAWVGFAFIAFAMVLAALPFVFGPDVAVLSHADVPMVSRRLGRRLMITDGFRAAALHFVWLIVLFLTLGSSYVAFGGALAFAGITGAFMGLFVGRWFDVGKGVRAARIGYGAMALSAVAKCFGFSLPWTAVAANAMTTAAWPSYATALNSQVYNLARQSPCSLRFHVVAEGGWDLGMAVGCGLAALLVYSGYGFFWAILLGLLGCIAGYVILVPTLVTADEGIAAR
jgi:MFS transporter, DHA1 family, inner membrane transport protein